MSTDCENLLKKFLVINPVKRASLEVNFFGCRISLYLICKFLLNNKGNNER